MNEEESHKEATSSLDEFTAARLNADEVGIDCRQSFEEFYAEYYLRRNEQGEYRSPETRLLWNCWWVAWEKAINTALSRSNLKYLKRHTNPPNHPSTGIPVTNE